MADNTKVVVIGAGMSTMERERSALIDSFDMVIRVNGFSTAPQFSPYVGTKTNVWVLQMSAAKAHMSAERLLTQKIARVVTVGQATFDYCQLSCKVARVPVEEYPGERHGAAKTILGYCPSTGMLALDWAVNVIHCPVVYHVGLDCFRKGGAHYYDAEKFSPKNCEYAGFEAQWMQSFWLRGAAYSLDAYSPEQHRVNLVERARIELALSGHGDHGKGHEHGDMARPVNG